MQKQETVQKKVAIITGITGQDGPYLARFLLEQGYEVIGLVRSYIYTGQDRLEFLGIKDKVRLELCDLHDYSQIIHIIERHQPDEIYNLAAQSSVSMSFLQPLSTIHFNVMSVLHLLEAVRLFKPDTRFYQASSSEMYGKVSKLPITENTVFYPLSPYAISKASAHWITINYREVHNLFACCGVLFNHESYLRSKDFFVKKVIRQSIEVSRGEREYLEVGNIDIRRDFGSAKRYVEAMWQMLQQEKPDDFIVCSGQSVSLRSIIEHVFRRLGIPPSRLVVSPRLFRPTEILDNYGDNSKAREILNWQYDLSFYEVLDEMIEEELLYG